jgi:hypothetical protein
MYTKTMFVKLSSFIVLLFMLMGCTTDDISPTLVSFSASEPNLVENNGAVTLTAKLNAVATQDIIVALSLSGSATLGVDYQLSSDKITINKGSDTGSITITSIDDVITEEIETILVNINAGSGINTLESYELTIQLLDNDADSDNDGVPDSEDDCPAVPGEIANNGCPYVGFLINELLYDPAADLAGDANGDGVRDPNNDEFIEFYNSGPSIDVSGYKIFDSNALTSNIPRHVFPSGTIVPSNGVIVVFGGGTPMGNFGGAIVQIASSGQINISNAGDIITLQDANGTVVLTLDMEPLSDNPDESYTRNPDVFGDFVQHSSIEISNGTLFSPGRKINGTSF